MKDIFKKLIQSSKPSLDVVKQIAPVLKTLAKVSLKTCRLASHYPIASITILFYLQSKSISVSAKEVQLVSIDQSPNPFYKHPFSYAGQHCFPYENILEKYHIITNVPDFNDVEYFFLAEKHFNVTHQKLKSEFVVSIAEENDVLLFEGVPYNTTFPCDTFCAGEYELSKAEKKPENLINMVEFCKERKMHYIDLPSTLRCYGWDVDKAQHPHPDQMEINRNLIAVDSLLNTEVVPIAAKNGLAIMIHAIEGLTIFIHNNLVSEYERLLKLINHDLLFDIKTRNRSLIKLLEQNTYPAKHTFIFEGSAHLFAKSKNLSAGLFDFYSLDPKDEIYELRQAISNKPHALLCPK